MQEAQLLVKVSPKALFTLKKSISREQLSTNLLYIFARYLMASRLGVLNPFVPDLGRLEAISWTLAMFAM